MAALLVIPIFVLILFLIYRKFKREKQRLAAISVWAKANGFEFSKIDPFNDVVAHQGGLFSSVTSTPPTNPTVGPAGALYEGASPGSVFEYFRSGDRRGTKNVLCASDNGSYTRIFDFWYEVINYSSNGGTETTRYDFTCLLLDVNASWPGLKIAREGFFSKMADHLGMEDQQFESEQFNKMFNVKGQDPRFSSALLDARMMQWLITNKEFFKQLEVANTWVLIVAKKLKATEYSQLLNLGRGFSQSIPNVVWDWYPHTTQQKGEQ